MSDTNPWLSYSELWDTLKEQSENYYFLTLNSYVTVAIPMELCKGNESVEWYIPDYIVKAIKEAPIKESFATIADRVYGEKIKLELPVDMGNVILLNGYSQSYWILGSYPTVLDNGSLTQYLPF